MSRITLSYENVKKYFTLEPLKESKKINGFDCSIIEYNDYLEKDAMRSQNDHIALTWLLIERSTGKIASYMSLIMDAIKLSGAEKELYNKNRKTISMRKDIWA